MVKQIPDLSYSSYILKDDTLTLRNVKKKSEKGKNLKQSGEESPPTVNRIRSSASEEALKRSLEGTEAMDYQGRTLRLRPWRKINDCAIKNDFLLDLCKTSANNGQLENGNFFLGHPQLFPRPVMRTSVKWTATSLGLLSLLSLLLVKSSAENLQLPQARADAFATAAVDALKALNGGQVPEAVKLEVAYKDEKRPAAFAKKDLQAALAKQGVYVKNVDDFVIKVSLKAVEVKVASKGPITVSPSYNLEGSVNVNGKLKPIAFNNADLAEEEKKKRLELADPIYESHCLLQGIHVDLTKAGGFQIGGPSLRTILQIRAKNPAPHISGAKVYSTKDGADYAVEVYPAKLVKNNGIASIVPAESPYLPFLDDNDGYAHVNFKAGDLFVLRIYNLDKNYEASARIAIDTLDSFEFSDNENRRDGRARWLIGKNDHVEVDGWDYKDGKALAFTIGSVNEINVGDKEETDRIQKQIAELKTPKGGGQICVSFRKVWPEGIERPEDERLLGKAPRVIPGVQFDRWLKEFPRERGAFRANIVIRYGEW